MFLRFVAGLICGWKIYSVSVARSGCNRGPRIKCVICRHDQNHGVNYILCTVWFCIGDNIKRSGCDLLRSRPRCPSVVHNLYRIAHNICDDWLMYVLIVPRATNSLAQHILAFDVGQRECGVLLTDLWPAAGRKVCLAGWISSQQRQQVYIGSWKWFKWPMYTKYNL